MNAPCVILDIGGVLEITPSTGWQPAWERRLGLPAGAARERLADVWRAGTVGEIGEAAVLAEVRHRLGLCPSEADALMADLWAEYLGRPNDELIGFVRALPSSVRLGILSNSFVGARERETELYRFDELVEEIVYSHEIGVCKPDPCAYRTVCDRLRVQAMDCLFIDDVPANVAAARDAGMQVLLFERNAEATARIRAHLRAACALRRPALRGAWGCQPGRG